jgi:hypothetical protein
MQRDLNSRALETERAVILRMINYMCVDADEQLTTSGFFNGGRLRLIINDMKINRKISYLLAQPNGFLSRGTGGSSYA